jgi:hypothetical protein
VEENGLAILSSLLNASKQRSVLVAALEMLTEFAATSSSPCSPAASSAASRDTAAAEAASGEVGALNRLTSANSTNTGLICRCGALG